MIPFVPILCGIGVIGLSWLNAVIASGPEEKYRAQAGSKYLHTFCVKDRVIHCEYDRAGVFRCDDPRLTGVQVHCKCLDPNQTRPEEWTNGPQICYDEAVGVTLFYCDSTERITLVNPDTVL